MNLIEKYYSHLSGLTCECQYTMRHVENATGEYNLVAVSSPADKINIVNNGYIIGLLSAYLKSRGMQISLHNPDKETRRVVGKMDYEYQTIIEYRKEEKKKWSDKIPYLLSRLAMSKMCVFKEEVEKSVVNVVEAARTSRSTYNNQPWRLVAYNNRIHIFCRDDKDFFEKQLYISKMRDIGMAIADMELAAEEEWLMTNYEINERVADKKIKNHEYVITMFLNKTV